MEKNFRINKVEFDKQLISEFRTRLESMYIKENKFVGKLSSRLCSKVGDYKNQTSNRINDIVELQYPVYEIVEVEQENKKVVGHFVIATFEDEKIHIPEVLFVEEKVSENDQKRIYTTVLSCFEVIAENYNKEELSIECHDNNYVYIEVLKTCGYNFYYDDYDIDTYTRIAVKNCKKKEVVDEGNNCSIQR
ncbi:MAG: hypothetical protein R3Y13_01170 [bacterium]